MQGQDILQEINTICFTSFKAKGRTDLFLFLKKRKKEWISMKHLHDCYLRSFSCERTPWKINIHEEETIHKRDYAS